MKKLIPIVFCLFPFLLFASKSETEDLVVSFDVVELPEGTVAFVNKFKDLRPGLSDFEVTHRKFLSNEIGERFALVTFNRTRGGVRGLKKDYVVGVLANGRRLYPIQLDGETQIREEGSVFLHFGQHKFPLVAIETGSR